MAARIRAVTSAALTAPCPRSSRRRHGPGAGGLPGGPAWRGPAAPARRRWAGPRHRDRRRPAAAATPGPTSARRPPPAVAVPRSRRIPPGLGWPAGTARPARARRRPGRECLDGHGVVRAWAAAARRKVSRRGDGGRARLAAGDAAGRPGLRGAADPDPDAGQAPGGPVDLLRLRG